MATARSLMLYLTAWLMARYFDLTPKRILLMRAELAALRLSNDKLRLALLRAEDDARPTQRTFPAAAPVGIKVTEYMLSKAES